MQAPQSGGQARRPMKAAPSIISVDLTVTGTLNTAGDIQVDGKVDGDVTTGSLTVGEKAVLNGDVLAEEVVVRGKIIGTIRAKKVQLCSTCHVEGDIFHQALAVETGAYFEGNCRHSDDPLKEQPTSHRRQHAPVASVRPPALARPPEHAPAALQGPPTHGPRLHGGLLGRPGPAVGRPVKTGETPEAQPGNKGK
ncbi:MAG: polymer-forming cytoskeletal protein [Alphaproteobacteria bacterium]